MPSGFLREAYIKWTGEGLSRDLRTISMDKGNYIMLELEPGYSGCNLVQRQAWNYDLNTKTSF